MDAVLLPKISDPSALKKFSLRELKIIAEEIRQKIIDVMAVNGGHLGSNMGFVELTIALHRIFDSPKDKMIFDVSHQSYPHKLLTGRQKQFPTIRQYNGLSGFTNPSESPHDHFFAGHAGTAISLGLGLSKHRDMQNQQDHILPIIGDATLTCGLALEALNNIPKDLKRFIIVLNDNNMSISHNVGAITKILSRLCKNPLKQIYQEVEKLLETFEVLNEEHRDKLKQALHHLVTSAPFFENYGLQYVGPVDGHDLESLLEVFETLKHCQKPTIVHVLTIKGKGLQVAEQNPISWHGCSPFDKVTGQKTAQAITKSSFPQVFGKHLLHMAEKDPSILAVTPAMPLGSCISTFMQKYPERCLDVGIAEGHAVTFCGAIASQKKLKVVCSIYSTFLQRAFDNLFHDVCLQQAPVVFALDRSGIATGDGHTHHGIYDIAFLNAMPNMIICQPRNGHLLKELLECSFSWNKPTTIRYPNLSTEEPDLPLQKRELGKGEILQEGKEIAIIALGTLASVAFEVHALLAQEGINATIVDPIFIKPLDTDLFMEIFMNHKYVFTLEEHAVNSGLGVIINTFAQRAGFTENRIRNFGVPEIFLSQGSHKEMLRSIQLDAESIAAQILKDCEENVLDIVQETKHRI